GHGVPVISSDRGAAFELFEQGGLVRPLPGRLTPAAPAALTPAELAPWVDAVLAMYDDPAFAAAQRSLAMLAGRRWSADQLAPASARFLAGLAGRRLRQRLALSPAVSRNGSAAAVEQLAGKHPWPTQRPEDAAPGEEQGWLGAGTEVMLTDALTPSTSL